MRKKWEYLRHWGELDELNELGAQGWELVTVIVTMSARGMYESSSSPAFTSSRVYIFKRGVEE